MSISTPEIVIERIKSATESSPIAVFDHPGEGLVEALFAATVATQERLKKEKPVCVAHKNSDSEEIRRLINEAANSFIPIA